MFEKIDGAEDIHEFESRKDNLGNNPEFVPLEDFAIDQGLTPDGLVMLMEEQKIENKDEKLLETEDISEDEHPSNWEVDVESGKYDSYSAGVNENKTANSSPVLTTSRNNVVQIEEMKGREQMERYWDAPDRKADNSKPKEKDFPKDSIRFDGSI